MRQKLTVSCSKGHTYEVAFRNFKSGRRCPECRKVSFEEVIQRANDNDYEVLSSKNEFKNASSLITVKCKYGHISKKRCDNLGQGCKECQDNDKRNNYNEIKQIIEKEGYTLLDDIYINNSTYLNLRCPNNHEIQMTYASFKSGCRCKECCHDNYRKDINEIINVAKKRGYTLLSTEYKNINSRLTFLCPNGHEFESSFQNFHYRESQCPYCKPENNSKGERRIESVLNDNKINYTTQYRFEDCIDKRALPFDFYLPTFNLAIEYDGEQHFRPIEIFGDESFYEVIKHDAIKNSYCEDNNITLLRIPYWEYKNIENILTQHINLE